MRLKKKH
jgi:hypothetical protein